MNSALIPATVTMPLSGGDAGTAQTIAAIRQLVKQGKKSPRINHRAIQIVWNLPPTDETGKAHAIFSWVLANTRFVPDMVGCETVRSADEIDEWRAGDCDDLNAVYVPALLGTIGIKSRLVTISSHPDDPNEFSHIYAEAFANGQWVPMDVARENAAFGRAPEAYFRKRIWEFEPPTFRDVQGLNGYAFERTRRGLGDGFTDALSTIFSSPQDINALTTGTANIVAASRANPYSMVPGAGVPAGYSYNSAGQLVPTATVTASAFGISPGILLLGGGLLLLLLLRR
ncbi:MAG TPA: transglutaminase-like domain-containing protein [Bryobacteraceae bacterium]|nr:transglutaminase-like domain-containing protein [Bryobacteraceae bacterium]